MIFEIDTYYILRPPFIDPALSWWYIAKETLEDLMFVPDLRARVYRIVLN